MLVPVPGTLVVNAVPDETLEYDDINDDYILSQLLLKKHNIEKQVDLFTEHYQQINNVLSHFNSLMESRLSGLHAKFREISEYLRELQDRGVDPDRYDRIQEVMAENPDFAEHILRIREHNASMSNKVKKKSNGAKRIFKKIAQKCHPDLTTVPWKLNLFRLAREAFSNNDYPTLEKLYKALMLNKSPDIVKTEEAIEELVQRLQQMQVNAQQILISDDFKHAAAYFSTSDIMTQRHIINWYATRLESFILEKANMINLLSDEPVFNVESIDSVLQSI
jgi:hypothetical protein